jgi:predicted metal-dependent hydrolase
MLDYQLIRSDRRKTLGLQVKQGRVIIRAPNFVKIDFINAFLQSKSAWVKAKIEQQKETSVVSCNFTSGCDIYLLGEKITLNVSHEKQGNVTLVNNEQCGGNRTLEVTISDRIYNKLSTTAELAVAVKKSLEQYFTIQAKNLFTQRFDALSVQTGLVASHLKIRQYRVRWGSCNSRKEISLNYLLMMTPLWVIDYVIIHELCHLVHLNHSKKFWDLVDQHYPNHLRAKQWLVTHQAELNWSLKQ